jgi:ABC-type Zn2+ transport system substrate-binding protein/surface adhesin
VKMSRMFNFQQEEARKRNTFLICRLMFIFAACGLGINGILLLTMGHDHDHDHDHDHHAHDHGPEHELEPSQMKIVHVLEGSRCLIGMLELNSESG